MAPSSSSTTTFSSHITLITLTSLLILSSSLSPPTKPNPRPFKSIYAFGDSYTDTGNTQSSTGPSSFKQVSNLPYGRTFFHKPTNRYSDGRLVIDFITQSLSLHFLPPYLNYNYSDRSSNGINFAVAGSTAIQHSFFVRNNLTLNVTPQSLQTQLYWFEKYLKRIGCGSGATESRECGDVFENSLFWVGEIGANDYAYSFGSSVNSSTIQKLAINSVAGFIQELLTKGAKYIVVQGLPTTGCLPLAMVLAPDDDRDDIGCVGSANNQSYIHNAALLSKLQYFRRQFPKSVIVYADYWNTYRYVMKNPRKYGFTELFKACCGSGGGPYNFDLFTTCGSQGASSCSDPSKYVNWDGVHLTEAMYKAVSELFINGNFSHPPFEYLLSRKQRSG